MQGLSAESKALNYLMRESHRIYYDAAAKLDLSDSAYDILFYIKSLGEGCLQRDICDKAALNKQTVNASIRQLEKKGILNLVPGKGREKNIYLTEAGGHLMQETIDTVIQLEHEAWMELDLEERHEYLRIYEKWNRLLKKNLEKINKKGD